MNDYPNNETLINVINAIDETKADRSELVQSDWNQNDETAADYVKNRPFYEDAEVLSLYDEYAYFHNGLDTGYETFFDSPLGLQSGETYNVTINDETLSIVYEAGYTGICRLSFNGANASVVIYDEWALSDFEGECYLKIEKCSTTLKQLDEKYIPDTIARVEDIPEINYPVTSVNGQTGDVQINIPEQIQSDWNQNDETATNYIKNKPSLATSEEIKALFN